MDNANDPAENQAADDHSSANSKLALALKLAAAGYPVLPCKRTGEAHNHANGGATTDAKVIRGWWHDVNAWPGIARRAHSRDAWWVANSPEEVADCLWSPDLAAKVGEPPPNGADPLANFPGIISFGQIKERTPSWVWYPYVPAGVITILGGKGNRCKGLICASATAIVTVTGCWPDGEPAECGAVLWCEAEDPKDTVVKPRLKAAGADPNQHIYTTETVEDFWNLDLRALIEQLGIRLIVLSPLNTFVKVQNIIDDTEVRKVLGKLQGAIEGTDCAVIGIAFLNKKSDLDALERLLGSVAFANFVRSALLVDVEKEPPLDVLRSVPTDQIGKLKAYRMVHAKWNLSTQGPDLLYVPRYVGSHPKGRDQYVKIEWHVTNENVDVDDLYRRKGNGKQSAGDWLEAYLREQGERPAAEVFAAGTAAGHSETALEKARQRRGITTRHDGVTGAWFWRIDLQ